MGAADMDSQASEAPPAVEVRGLTVGYGDTVVLEDINFSVAKGEVFAILGGSGCGKSTILKHIIGLHTPMSGDILLGGHSIVHCTEAEKLALTLKFGVLYQSGALFSSLSLAENIILPIKEFTGLSDCMAAALARVKLSLVGLEGFEDFAPSEISGGMRKRAALARAMALDPGLLFFDEPSAGLDPISSADLDRLILDLKKSVGATMVIVTHELESVFAVADRVVLLNKESKGIVAEGDPRHLRDRSTDPRVLQFLNRSPSKG